MSDQSFIALRSLLTEQAGGGGFVRLSRAWYRAVGKHRDAALLIDELLFRADVSGADEDGWFHVTDAELAEKLCCGVKAVAAGRDRLDIAGWIDTARRGVPARTFYRINLDAIVARFAAEQVMPQGRTGNAPRPNRSRPKAEHSYTTMSKSPKTLPPAAPAGGGTLFELPPAADRAPTFSDVVLAHVEEAAGIRLRLKDGSPSSSARALLGKLGAATNDNAASACALWSAFLVDRGQFLRASRDWPEQFSVWHKSRVRITRPGGASRTATVAPASAEEVARARAAHAAMVRPVARRVPD